MKATCRVITPPHKEACGKPAKFRVTFKDEDTVTACAPCKLHLEQTAEEHRTQIKVEPLDAQ
jgi:hypothetical protein